MLRAPDAPAGASVHGGTYMNKRIHRVEDEKNIVDILSFNLGRRVRHPGGLRRGGGAQLALSRTRTLSCWI